MHPLRIDETLRDGISHVKLAGTERAVLEAEASDIAWMNRWAPWPHQFGDLVAAEFTGENLRIASYLCTRRLHFAFAHRLLAEFAEHAHAAFGDQDTFLQTLALAGRSALTRDPAPWAELFEVAATAPTSKRTHIVLSTVFTSERAPVPAVEAALESAKYLTGRGDLVAAYRVASFLRRLGRFDEAFDAIEHATELLVLAQPGEELGDHMVERLLAERQLLAARS